MEIKTSSIIWINIGGQEFQLSKKEAMVLFEQLQKELGIKDKEVWPPMPPYIPLNPLPKQPLFPSVPDYPSSPNIWCQQPTSSCSL